MAKGNAARLGLGRVQFRELAVGEGSVWVLGDWLDQVHPTLQNPVRLRIEGERVGLPGPALTPYLAGLLVLLGMLGTFLGMVVTLNGAVFALEGTTDLQAILQNQGITQLVVTGVTTEVTMAAAVIPAGLLGTNGAVMAPSACAAAACARYPARRRFPATRRRRGRRWTATLRSFPS